MIKNSLQSARAIAALGCSALAVTACAGSSIVWDERVPFPVSIGCWGGYLDRVGDWSHIDPVGWIYDEGEEGDWVFFPDHGWIYASMGAGSQTCDQWWLYSPETGWYWSSTAYYPWMWRESEADWVNAKERAIMTPSLYKPITEVATLGTADYASPIEVGGRGGFFGLFFDGDDSFGYLNLDAMMPVIATDEGWNTGLTVIYPAGTWNAHADIIHWLGMKFYRVRPIPEPMP